MSGFPKFILVMAGLGLLGNLLMAPTDHKPDESSVAYAQDTKEQSAQVEGQSVTEVSTPAKDFSKIEGCIASNKCAFHIVGVGTMSPYLQLSVIAAEAKGWTEGDWQLAVDYSKTQAKWVKNNPYSAMQKFGDIPEDAPFFRAALQNIEKRLDKVSVGVVSVRRSVEPRKGVPGWTAKNDPSRALLPI